MVTQKQINKSLDISYWKGAFASGMTGLTQEFFTPLLLFIGARSFHIGVVNSSANLIASLIQLISSELTDRCGTRKRMVVGCIVLQAFVLALIPILVYIGIRSPRIFIVRIVLFTTFGSLFIPA